MKFFLKRSRYTPEGIFGQLENEHGKIIAVTLEHAYYENDGWVPKLPAGDYVCEKGEHRLASMDHTFTTYEILNVPGHTGILFHVGNYNADSEGCVLLGSETMGKIIVRSKAAFVRFMQITAGVDTFDLTVQN